MNNVTSSCRLDWTSVVRVPADAATVEAFRLQPGDVLFNNTNSAELVGKSALFEGFDEPVVFSNHFTRVRTDDDQLAPEFLAAWFQELWISGLFQQICHRWVGQAAVQRERLLELEMPLPDIREQRRIAQALRRQMAEVQRVRAAAEAQLEASSASGAACLRKVFEGSTAATWPRRRLVDLLAQPVKTGISRPLAQAASKRCLTLSAVRDGVLDLSASKPVDVSDAEAEGNWVKPGAFYVVRGNGQLRLVGRGALASQADRPVLYPDLLFEVVTDPHQIDSEYLGLVWQTEAVRRDVERRARTSAGIFKINQANLVEVLLPVPTNLEDQQRIVVILTAQTQQARRLQEALAGVRTEIECIVGALLRRAFSGES